MKLGSGEGPKWTQGCSTEVVIKTRLTAALANRRHRGREREVDLSIFSRLWGLELKLTTGKPKTDSEDNWEQLEVCKPGPSRHHKEAEMAGCSHHLISQVTCAYQHAQVQWRLDNQWEMDLEMDSNSGYKLTANTDLIKSLNFLGFQLLCP